MTKRIYISALLALALCSIAPEAITGPVQEPFSSKQAKNPQGQEKETAEMVKGLIKKGEAHEDSYQRDSALRNYQDALRLMEKEGKPLLKHRLLQKMAQLAQLNGNMRKAIQYHQKAASMAKEMNDYEKAFDSLKKLADLLFDQKKYSLAYEYYEQSLKLSEIKKDTTRSASLFINLAQVNRKLGNLNRSLTMLNRALQFYKARNNLPKQKLIFEEISETYTQKKSYEKALGAFRTAMLINDSINSRTGKADMENINNEVRLLRKELTTKNKEISQIKNSIKEKYETLTIRFLALVLISSLAIIGFMLFLLGRKKNKNNLPQK